MCEPADSRSVRVLNGQASSSDEAIIAAHDAALEHHEPGYRDPTSGLFVFSAAFLADRGWCCDSGCRHCPFVA